jgi:hypothetical protein
MKQADIIKDIHGLDVQLAALEEQDGLLSADFYHFYRAGELEQTRDFIRWAAFYEAKQERESSYRQLAYGHFSELRRRSGLGAFPCSNRREVGPVGGTNRTSGWTSFGGMGIG